MFPCEALALLRRCHRGALSTVAFALPWRCSTSVLVLFWITLLSNLPAWRKSASQKSAFIQCPRANRENPCVPLRQHTRCGVLTKQSQTSKRRVHTGACACIKTPAQVPAITLYLCFYIRSCFGRCFGNPGLWDLVRGALFPPGLRSTIVAHLTAENPRGEN